MSLNFALSSSVWGCPQRCLEGKTGTSTLENIPCWLMTTWVGQRHLVQERNLASVIPDVVVWIRMAPEAHVWMLGGHLEEGLRCVALLEELCHEAQVLYYSFALALWILTHWNSKSQIVNKGLSVRPYPVATLLPNNYSEAYINY